MTEAFTIGYEELAHPLGFRGRMAPAPITFSNFKIVAADIGDKPPSPEKQSNDSSESLHLRRIDVYIAKPQ
jgi:hypothetical protein